MWAALEELGAHTQQNMKVGGTGGNKLKKHLIL